ERPRPANRQEPKQLLARENPRFADGKKRRKHRRSDARFDRISSRKLGQRIRVLGLAMPQVSKPLSENELVEKCRRFQQMAADRDLAAERLAKGVLRYNRSNIKLSDLVLLAEQWLWLNGLKVE